MPGDCTKVWPRGREVVAVAAPEMCNMRFWTVVSSRRRGKSSEVHNKRRMSRRAILLGLWACLDRN